MNKLFDLNNPLMRALSAVANVLLLSCLWLICSIPVITIGPATAAMYYVTQKMVQGEKPGVFRCFFKSFRENLGQGLVLTLIFGLAAAVMYYDYIFSYMVAEDLGKILRIFFAVMAAFWLILACYAFPLQAQFQNPIGRTLKNALLLSLMYLGKTVQLVVLHLIPVAVCLLLPELFAQTLPLWLFIAPGGIAYLSTLRLKKEWAHLLKKSEEQAEAAPEKA